ncbi:unnamed protein product, partial [Didymodactylos carnosus]
MQLSSKSHWLPRMTIPTEKKRQLDQAAINCTISDARPWGDFKRSGMANFLSVAVPGYTGPSSRTVQRMLAKLYFQKQEDFKIELAKVPNVSITADLWQNARRRHYLCMTVHWLDSNFHLKGKVLSFRKFKGRHLAIRIRLHMKRIIAQYDLLNKITASTTDNGSNIKAATGQIRFFGVRFHCLAHALNLTIHKGLHLWPKKTKSTTGTQNVSDENNESIDFADDDASDDEIASDQNDEQAESDRSSDGEDDDDEQFDRDDDSSASSSSDNDDDTADFSSPLQMHDIGILMEKCRTIITTIRKSSILYETVHTLAIDSSIKAGLIIDMRIRWNSSYKMLQRLLLYQSVLDKLYDQLDSLPGITDKQRNKLFDAKLSGADYNMIQSLRRVLERFDEAIKVLSGQKYPTLSLTYAIVFSLLHYLNYQSADVLDNEIKDLLLDSFNKYMIRDGKEMALIRVSALLDSVINDLLTPEDKQAAETFIIKE